MKTRLFFLAALGVVAGCDRAAEAPPPVTPQTAAAVGDDAPTMPATPAPAPPQAGPTPETTLIAEAFVLDEWERADNREVCAPLAFTATGQARGAPRRADFGGGWGVAFDLPNLRSAYGIAGPGPVEADRAEPDAQRERLRGQWPHFIDLAALPRPAFAGYGMEGGRAYPADNPAGRGVNSLAYVRVGGQECTYNVWSRLGRAHLETLLGSLRTVRVD
jgi:hypothetical protein